jgi:hypothetical protein
VTAAELLAHATAVDVRRGDRVGGHREHSGPVRIRWWDRR